MNMLLNIVVVLHLLAIEEDNEVSIAEVNYLLMQVND